MGEIRRKYAEIRDALREEICGGKYGPGRRFPSEAALARRFCAARQTVVRALRELQAQGLLSRRQGAGTVLTPAASHLTGRIALIVHGSGYCEIFAPIAREISHLCLKHGCTLLFTDIDFADNRQRVAQVMRQAREYVDIGVDGVIFQPVELMKNAQDVNREIVELFDASGIPVVLLDSDIVPAPERSRYDLAAVNHFAAGMKLAEHLRRTGSKRVVYLMQHDRAPCVQARFMGIRTGCEGLQLEGRCVFAEPDDAAAIRRCVRRLKPDAIACYNDRQAALLMQTLAGMGVKVPGDVRVAGFDDVNYAMLATPRLTTMHQPCRELAELAFDMLMARIKAPDAPAKETFLNATLVVRESTGKGK